MPIQLTRKQSSVWKGVLANPHYRRILLDGAARSSKTWLALTWLLSEVGSHPGIRCLAARKYRANAKNSTWQDIKSILSGRKDFELLEGSLEVRHRMGGTLLVDGLDQAERAEKILGTSYCHVLIDEATQLSWPTVQMAMSRLSQDCVGVTARKLILACNPREPTHWLHRVGIERVNPEDGSPLSDAATWARVNWTPKDNPHLPADTIASLEALTGSARRRLFEGLWVRNEGLVYPMEPESYVADMPDGMEVVRTIIGCDYGHRNAAALVRLSIDAAGNWWIDGERVASGLLNSQIVADAGILAMGRANCIVACDPSAAGLIAEYQAKGMACRKADNSVEGGISVVRTRLGDGRLKISPSCSHLLGEMAGYSYGDGGKPVKLDDHACDAMRYASMAAAEPDDAKPFFIFA